jgi:hypothetical protein
MKDEAFEVGSTDHGTFFLSDSKFKFEVIKIYGPVDHSRPTLFLRDLESKVVSCSLPVVVLGDFNPIRGAKIKTMPMTIGRW